MIDYTTILEFETVVMDIVSGCAPKNSSDYEAISDELHQSVENAIFDLILDSKNKKIEEEYEPRY